MKTIKDYHDFYLKCDVLLLADVFEERWEIIVQIIMIMSESLLKRTRFMLRFNA